jgi:hypothetical protein
VLIPSPETTLGELVETELSDMDVVIAEGFRSAGPETPKLFVGEPAQADGLHGVIGFLRLAGAPIPDDEADRVADQIILD